MKGDSSKRSYRRFLQKAVLGCVSFFLAAIGAAQQVIENPKKPAGINAGRVIELKEVARITDEPGKFFFVGPIDVFAGEDGSVYVQDVKKLFKFDARGKFLKNLLKMGEGPGEINADLPGVMVRRDDILLSGNRKFIRIDLEGKLLEERNFGQFPVSNLLGFHGGRFFFLKRDLGEYPRITGIYEVDSRLVIFPEEGEMIETPYLMPVTVTMYFRPGVSSSSSISRMMPTWTGDRDVFLFHTPEYLIKHLDLEAGKVVRSFKREYDRVRYDARPPKGYPQELIPKYHNDLCRLLWRNGELWAVTSTFDPKKGILVDVFSPEGKYLDNFYLPLFKIRKNNPQYYAPMALWGDLLYLLEADEDDLISLVKYKIVGEKPANP